MKSLMSLFAVAFVLLVMQPANAETKVAGLLGPVQVSSAKLVNPKNFPNLGITTYDIVVTVESSNACMVPDMFVQKLSETNDGEYTLTGVYAQGGCSGELNPVVTEVLVGQKIVIGDGPLNVTVNGVPASVQ